MNRPGRPARARGEIALRRDRASLLRTTALQAAVLTVIALPAGAQPAPNARPSGGQVVAGGASISQASPSATVITQSTSRAAINWQGFSVGAQQSVDFQQPSSSAVTLNRVTGPDPSAIAGQIHANGGVVLTNPNGVVFSKGSQVNAQDVIVSTAGITNQNFMAGRMVFDQPGNPGAKIANAGTITVKDTGLAALVAPAVANSGVISARLGHAVLAGAAAATLDMYGDGLLSVDVTRQVTQGPKGRTALVTNTGTIVANGGNILLTAQAADGVVQNLVAAGGKIAADSIGKKTGTIAIAGTGGSIVITGSLSAQGLAAGSTGGSIELVADKAVTLAPHARVNASGAAGGGTVAVGTSLARAVGGPSVTAPIAAVTTIAKGARVLANATKSGNGGRVTVLSTQSTAMNGTVQAKGGPFAGNGGTVEISTGGALTLNGSVDVTAAHGALGDILLDPYDLDIFAGTSTGSLNNGTDPNLAYNAPPTAIGNVTTITPAQIEALNGNVHLQTIDDIDVQSSVTLTTLGQGFTIEAGNNLTVNGGVTISTAGSIALVASSTLIPGFTTTGTLEMIGSVASSGGNILLQGGSGGVIVAGDITAPAGGLVDLKGDIVSILTTTNATPLGGLGGFVSVPGGQLTIEPYSFGHPMELIGSLSTATAGSLSVSTTELQLVNAATLALGTQLVSGGTSTVGGTINIGQTGDAVSLGTIGQLSLFASTVTQGAALVVGTLSGQTGSTTLLNTGNQIGTISGLSATALSLQDAIPLVLAGTDLIDGNASIGDTGSVAVTGELGVVGTLTLNVAGAVTEATGGSIIDLGSPLTLTGSVGTLALSGSNSIDVLGPLAATSGAITIADAQPLTIIGPVTATGSAVAIADTGGAISIVGNLTGSTVNLGATGTIGQTGGILTANTLFAAGTALSLAGDNTIGTIGSLIATAGSIAFSDLSGVTAAGPVTAAGNISLSTAGAMTLDATLTTPATLTLAATGSIAEGPGGVIIAGTLAGSSGAGTSLSNLNEVGAIGSFASTGGFVLTQDSTALTIIGPLTDTTSISLSTQGQILLAGTLSAPTVSIATTETFAPLDSGSTPVTGGALATIDSIIQSSGGVTADVLNINSGGGVNMQEQGTTNSVANLGTVIAANQFNLVDQTSVTIAGPGIVSGPTINAGPGTDFYYQYFVSSPGDVVVAAPISGAVVGLFATGNLTETAGGTITTGFLQGSGGSISLTQAANAIGEIDLLTSTTNLALTDGSPLLLNGAISAGTGNTLIINNDSLTLGAGAAISAPGGTVQLAPVNPGDAFTIGNASGLTTLTAITADTLVIGASTAGVVTINATTSNFDASSVGTLALLSGASVAENGPDGLIANTLTGNVAGSASLPGANQIATLGSFTTGSEFALSNANPGGAALTITGPVTANIAAITSTTGPITVAGTVSANQVLLATTGAPGGLGETASGVVVTSALGVSVSGAGPASLTGANLVTGFDSITVGSFGFTLTNATDLNVTGEGGIASTGPVVLRATGSLGISTTISGTALDLVASGSIAESSAGALIGTSLTGSASAANFGQAGNAIGTLGAFTSTGGFTLLDGSFLTVAGPVTDGTQIAIGAPSLAVTGALTAPLVGLAATTGAITLAGNITAGSEIALASGGSIAQGGGVITSPLLTGSSGATVALNGANTIAAIGSFTAGGSFSLNDDAALQVAGSLVAPSVNLVSTGAISEGTTAALITSLLTGSGSAVSLPAAGNQISGIGSFATTTGFAVTDAVPVTVSGPVSTGTGHVISISDGSIGFAAGGALVAQGGTIVLEPATAGAALTLGGSGAAATTANELLIDTGGPVGITGALNLADVTTVLLVTAGAVSETTGGAITAPLLTGTAATAALGGPNTIAALGSFTTTGAFALNDTANLTLTGVLKAPSATLVSGGTITEAGGALITAGTLAGSANTALLTGANTIATLGAFTAGTGLFLTDDTSLVVSGPVGGGVLSAIASSGSLTVGGTITGTSVNLAAATALSESGGVINVATLAASGASVTLLGSNSIANLGTVSAAGGLQLADAGALTIGGNVAAGPFASFSGGAVSEAAGGSVAAGTLTVSVASLALGASNTIGTLGVASAPGGLLLNDAVSLVVSGPAGSATTAATSLTSSGSIAITGALSGGTVNLVAAGAASESGAGLINAGTLSGSFAAASLGGVNTIAALGSITTPATLSLTEPGSLNIAGPVTAPAVILTLGGALTESGLPNGAVLAPGPDLINELSGPKGSLITGSLTATAAGGIALGTANQITAIASLSSPGAVSVSNAIDLGLAGPIAGSSVNLVSSGALTQSAGTITTPLLTGSAGGAATLTDSNAIGTLGAFSAGGALTVAGPVGGALSLVNGGALTVAGPVSATGLSLTAGGPIAITGSISTGTFFIGASGSIVQSAGVVSASLLTGNAIGAAVFGPDAPGPVAYIGQLGSFTVTGGTLSVASSEAMTVSGPVSAANLALSAPDFFTLASGTITTTSGTIAVTGGALPAMLQTGTTSVTAAGNQAPLLTLSLPGSGIIDLEDLSAPTATLQLNTASGSAYGLIDVAALAVSGQGGNVGLSGAVAGNATPTAALISTISPAVNANYTLNGCVIMAASCAVAVPTFPFPTFPFPTFPFPTFPFPTFPFPLQTSPAPSRVIESIVLPPNSGVSIVPDLLDNSDSASGSRSAFRIPFLSGLLAYVFSRDVDDPDLVLPNISDRDY